MNDCSRRRRHYRCFWVRYSRLTAAVNKQNKQGQTTFVPLSPCPTHVTTHAVHHPHASGVVQAIPSTCADLPLPRSVVQSARCRARSRRWYVRADVEADSHPTQSRTGADKRRAEHPWSRPGIGRGGADLWVSFRCLNPNQHIQPASQIGLHR